MKSEKVLVFTILMVVVMSGCVNENKDVRKVEKITTSTVETHKPPDIVLAFPEEPTSWVECDSCESCTSAINENKEGVGIRLNRDIRKYDGNHTCIKFKNVENVLFDCSGHRLENNEENLAFEISGGGGNTIRNCIIYNFYQGISMKKTSGAFILNNTVYSAHNAFWASDSVTDSIIYGNKLINNSDGFFIGYYNKDSVRNNLISDNIVCGYELDMLVFEGNIGWNNTCNNYREHSFVYDLDMESVVSCFRNCSEIEGELMRPEIPFPEKIISVIECDSCESCSQAVQTATSGMEVRVSKDLKTNERICINFFANGMVFNCRGHRIEGVSTEGSSIGLRDIEYSERNIIKNCLISGFHTGIYLYGSIENRVENNELYSNDKGIYLGYARNGELINNSIHDNKYGISFSVSDGNTLISNSLCSNSLDFIIANSDLILSYNNTCHRAGDFNDIGFSECTYKC